MISQSFWKCKASHTKCKQFHTKIFSWISHTFQPFHHLQLKHTFTVFQVSFILFHFICAKIDSFIDGKLAVNYLCSRCCWSNLLISRTFKKIYLPERRCHVRQTGLSWRFFFSCAWAKGSCYYCRLCLRFSNLTLSDS